MKFSNLFLTILGFGIMLFGATSTQAQSPAAWTLEDSARRALEIAPEMRAANTEIKARTGELSQSDVWPNPTIAIRADEKSAITQQNRRGGYNLSQITFTQPIPLRRLEHQQRAAEQKLASAQAERIYQRLQIEARTAQAFHALQLAAEQHSLAQQRMAFAEQPMGAAKRKDRLVRYVSPLDRARLDMLLQTAQQALAEAEGKWSEAAAQFRALLALAPDAQLDSIPLIPANRPATLNALLDQMASHPALQAIQLSLDANRSSADMEREQRLADPTLSIFLEQDEFAGVRRNYTGIMLGVQIPLWGQNSSALLRALADSDKTESQLAAQRRDLENRLRQNHLHLGHVLEQAENYRTRLLVPAQRVLDLTRKGFAAGEQNALELIDASNTYFASQAHYLELLHDAWFEAAQLRLNAGISILGNAEVQS